LLCVRDVREALDAPSLSRLTWDMPKILLRIAIVLVLGLLVSTANAKVMIYVDLDAQQMTVTRNNGETLVWKYASGVNRRRFPIFPGADVHAAAASAS
jgi:hypothetical protein